MDYQTIANFMGMDYQTISNNALIAKFMDVYPFDDGDGAYYQMPEFGHYTVTGVYKSMFRPEFLKYHKSWDWLMPVLRRLCAEGYILSENKGWSITMDIQDAHKLAVRLIKDHYDNAENN